MDSFQDLFDMACRYCQSELSEVAYNLWIKDIEPLKFDGSVAYLFVRSEFKKSIIEEKYLVLLKKAFASVLGFEVDVNLSCENPDKPAPGFVPTAAAPGDGTAASSIQNGEYEYTFSTFIVGPSNKFAHAACWAVATNPANSYNPLFIYGQSGLGKTHLLCAVSEEVRQTNPGYNIIYVKGEEFTNELINAIASKNTSEFHEKYRAADLLAVDDIQFIAGKESTQEEFFHTFNTLFQSGKQIILTSDRPPKEIKTLEDRLRTRFEWGLLADIQPPDFETRVAIIRRKAELLNLDIPDDVAEYIANRLKNNIRQLEGAVKKLKAYKQLAGSNPSILIAQSAIKDILSDHQPIPMTVERIITEVARTYSVTSDDIRSSKRSSNISTARQVSMYIVREITQMSMSSIGEEFGNRDHSTVVYATQQVQKNMDKDTRFKETVEDIIKNIRTM
ncbi:MAG: chromosomal replication initiator protein DnaA [Angelakisella sp.]|nr:chromosomal replication initiator protein DnaA [Angelakisella sp.]